NIRYFRRSSFQSALREISEYNTRAWTNTTFELEVHCDNFVTVSGLMPTECEISNPERSSVHHQVHQSKVGHHARAAELVMHQERVERHSKGITATLNEFKTRFQTMIEEHNDETDKFKKAVQALEATFTSATKTHELVAIQDHVSGQKDGYMNQIRISLRKFRQDLDGMLSSLRNSNARFRKSFKVFSEGGNFSLDEVEDYRKKLERMANKIDQAEGTIMAELEGMESKRYEAAHEYAGKLDDRFKHHLFDLTFMEKSSRWTTNTQVKIKTEVAKSNSQAKNLVITLAKIERHIDAVRNPNLDKEVIQI
ncbi:Hypothetical predicted protein, partial [Paramuricea clavata]